MATVEHEVVEAAEVTVREVLHRAADLLEEFGWCQGTYGSIDREQFCMIGAVNQAARDLGYDTDRWGKGNPHGFTYWATGALAEWNDTDGRTKAEVVARLREAAEAAA